ncbi:hypothetical protein FHR92_005374 [Fontibacillus solani]|uniref:Uncharacterized protein n=1 Tax=Fontibacillus solani TaxID=1572857 RepID=A0A7W3SZ61_9BACL|nr:hypothetical protein [Fontibacillus solani]MBA9088829.1 hypothetical protein [Fontibacillus solani]
MENLMNVYGEWRMVSEEMIEDGYAGSIDCGEMAVREDFSNFAGLNEVISFEDMLEIERAYA